MTTPSKPELSQLSVGEIAARLPGATGVFHKYKVDFCCKGDMQLADAAQQQGVELSDLEAALETLEESRKLEEPHSLPSFSTDDSCALIDHILTRYHEVHRRELTELIALAQKVEGVHARHPQVPLGLSDLLRQMQGKLEVHMKKEELVLFPAMRGNSEAMLDTPIGQMRHDHHGHGEFLQRLEALTNEFTPPEGACRSWQALYAGVAKLSEDLMDHIHLENNVLFPRFQQTSPS